jgi:hypothetical protein
MTANERLKKLADRISHGGTASPEELMEIARRLYVDEALEELTKRGLLSRADDSGVPTYSITELGRNTPDSGWHP